MNDSIAQAVPQDALIRAAGGFAIVSGIISAVGVVSLITMFILFATSLRELGLTFGLINDISVALHCLLAIPIALALHRILLPHNAPLMRVATPVGIVAMVIAMILQLLLVFEVLTFQQQGVWVSLAMLLGVGSWLMITGLVARSTGRLPNSVVMSAIAVPYIGYPVWAFWLGRQLLNW